MGNFRLLLLILSAGFLDWASGGPSPSGSSESSLTLRERVHPANLTIQSQQKQGSTNNTKAQEKKPREGGQVVQGDGPLRCYVCSWSILGNAANNDSVNVDVCSTNHFIPERAAVASCEHGCETKAYRNSKKEGKYFVVVH